MWIDVNVHLSRWPTRRLPHDTTPQLVSKLKSLGVTKAWAGSFDAILHRDVAAVNQRLADDCREGGADFLVPFGTVNPMLPDWREDLRRCVEVHRMPGIRLYPNYHQYALTDPLCRELLDLCGQRGRLVQIAVALEDERTQHPLLKMPAVDVRPLPDLLKQLPRVQVVLLNALRSVRVDDLPTYCESGRLSVEVATLEGAAGIDKLLRSVSHERILFGTHFPFFYAESAVLKLRESELAGVQREAILFRNAQALMEKQP